MHLYKYSHKLLLLKKIILKEFDFLFHRYKNTPIQNNFYIKYDDLNKLNHLKNTYLNTLILQVFALILFLSYSFILKVEYSPYPSNLAPFQEPCIESLYRVD